MERGLPQLAAIPSYKCVSACSCVCVCVCVCNVGGGEREEGGGDEWRKGKRGKVDKGEGMEEEEVAEERRQTERTWNSVVYNQLNLQAWQKLGINFCDEGAHTL